MEEEFLLVDPRTGEPAARNADVAEEAKRRGVELQLELSSCQVETASSVATSSADLGAYQNRFQAAITGLNTDSTNLSAAKSSIVDANYAQATSDLSKAQILQQAGTAMVAQANVIPQNILTLLQKLP